MYFKNKLKEGSGSGERRRLSREYTLTAFNVELSDEVRGAGADAESLVLGQHLAVEVGRVSVWVDDTHRKVGSGE